MLMDRRQRHIAIGLSCLLLPQALASAQSVRARISFKVVLDANGNPPPEGGFSPATHIEERVLRANELLALNGADWRLDLVEIVEVAGISQFYAPFDSCPVVRHQIETAAEADPATYHWRTDAINVYVIQHAEGCAVCARVMGGDNIVISNVQAPPSNQLDYTLIHEVGHYLDLCHTQGCFCALCGSTGCPTQPADDDDEVDDTLSDSPCWNRENIAAYSFGVNYSQLSPENQRAVDATYGNLMSYHLDDGNVLTRFTPGQIRKMAAEMHPLSGRRLAVISRLPSDCNQNGIPDELDLVSGASQDCNDDAIPDECNVASGADLDCNHNLVPDSCEADCNHNGISDACDLAAGTASDCNHNGIPDACDVVPSGQSFSPGPSVLLGEDAADLVLADLDGDGLPDLAAAIASTATVRIHRNDGSGALTLLAEPNAGGDGPVRIVAVDLDGDGSVDLVVLHAGTFFAPGESLAVLRGRGDGTFAEAVLFATGLFPFEMAAADLDGDGRPDLVTSNFNSQDLTVLLNQTEAGGPIAFAPPVSYALPSRPSALAVLDLDQDGRLDFLAGSTSAPGLELFRGLGGGSFTPAQHLDVDVSPRTLAAGDLDGDGATDIAALDVASEGVRLLFSRGGGLVPAPALELEEFASAPSASHVALAEISGDGRLDILASLESLRAVSYLRSLGGGRFDAPRLIDVSSAAARLVTGDIDGDGDLDLGALTRLGAFETVLNALTLPHSTDRDGDGVPDECAPPPLRFRRGNANADAAEDISDAITVLGFLFLGRPERLACDKAADVNDDGSIDLSDAVALLNHLFLGALAPPEPFGECGVDPTEDGLACGAFGPCG
jgi:hypothetical protein